MSFYICVGCLYLRFLHLLCHSLLSCTLNNMVSVVHFKETIHWTLCLKTFCYINNLSVRNKFVIRISVIQYLTTQKASSCFKLLDLLMSLNSLEILYNLLYIWSSHNPNNVGGTRSCYITGTIRVILKSAGLLNRLPEYTTILNC